MIYKFTKRLSNTWDPTIEPLRKRLELPDLNVLRDFYIEVRDSLDESQLESLASALGDGVVETVERGLPLQAGRMAQVTYKRGIVDNENDSIVALCALVGIEAIAGKVATTYESNSPGLLQAVRDNCCNPNIEEIHTQEPEFETLLPMGVYQPMETFDLRGLNDEELAELGKRDGRNLNLRQMKQIHRIQSETGAPYVTDVLLEALDARWSDHCSHTTWRSLDNLLGYLVRASKATGNPNIISMFHDNAGVWDFYEDYCLAFKAETHNGPSAISAYFGQLTKLGGVLRDILGTGKGADPIGVFEYTATGRIGTASPIQGRPSPKQIAIETIRAIKEYGNTFGVPMMWSHMAQHPLYRAKPFALGGSIGLVPKRFAQRGEPQPGDHLLVIGGLTGNDGIHGASASSAGSSMDSAAVQIGSPLEQIKFREAIIDLRDAGCTRALTDVGGAGLNSAIGEIGDPNGVWLNTALVPLKTSGLPMWRILLSESQERMVLAIIPEKLDTAREILDRHSVRQTIVGRFTNSGRYCVVHDPTISEAQVIACDPDQMPRTGEVGLDVPYTLLDDAPEQQQAIPPVLSRTESVWPDLKVEDVHRILIDIARDSEVMDQKYAGTQYDSTVQGRTIYGPYYGRKYKVPSTYWACSPLYGKPQSVVFSASFEPWLFAAHPTLATRQSFLAALTGQVLAGVAVNDICLCDNFYTPHLEEGCEYWLVQMVKELADLVEAFGVPVISGKDSSAGSTHTEEGLISVPPAVFLSALGKVPDGSQLLPNEWQQPGNLLVRIGPDCNSLAGTVASRVLNLNANDVDDLPIAKHREFLEALANTKVGTFESGTSFARGGFMGQALLGVLASGFGVEVFEPDQGLSQLLKEHRCGGLVEVSEDRVNDLSPKLNPQVVGRITDRELSIVLGGKEMLSDEIIEAWCSTFEDSLL